MEKTQDSNAEQDSNINTSRSLLPGFRFHPTEEELVEFYLRRKVERKPFTFELIKEADLYSFDPWDLPGLGRAGDREWFFFVPRNRRQQNGGRPNRISVSGYWKATGTDGRVYAQASSRFVGLKKTLVFYKGKAPKGERTDWIMHEYRLSDSDQDPNDFTLCRIYRKAATSITSFDRRPRIEPETRSQARSNISKPISAEERNPYTGAPGFSDPCVEKAAIRRKASCTIPSSNEKGNKTIGLSSMEETSTRPPKKQSLETHGCFSPCLTHVNSFDRWCSELICYTPSTLDSLWDHSV